MWRWLWPIRSGAIIGNSKATQLSMVLWAIKWDLGTFLCLVLSSGFAEIIT